jgi:hypothetical protein
LDRCPSHAVGDVCLATNFTELQDGQGGGGGSWGTPNVGWFDTEGEPYVNSICAMETNSSSLELIMFRPDAE